ncbi:hypothetical protein QTH27_03730 [Clostridium perfringens]|uniref:hypothetical protein n=1 Tax=Clostridium perfringens TaxID=1502 RepID=UPI0018974138|nr:hypothetical protein [Clostridium perfringens]MDM0471065.1 hypothetical protein [Clostridium perfringens]MDM0476892.1 hypothetical protein [Clostridium perfringens]MDM0479799.1 hypothetical protein [Clostridium perfringens]MDM0484966.1 hypothetical protein [Clostridium perfringens]MDM0919537.1 hypothetical protein [Clostridium perfringens]
MAKNNDEVLILHENLISIDALNDYWKVHKATRESVYYLDELVKFININNIELSGKNKILNSYKILSKKFNQLDKSNFKEKIMNLNENEVEKEVAAEEYISFGEQFELIIQYINLKCELNKLQYDLLKQLVSYEKKENEILVKDNNLAKQKIKKMQIDNSIRHILKQSHEKDKLDTYIIYVDTKKMKKSELKELRKDLRKKGYSERYFLYDIKDYEYLLRDIKLELKDELNLKDKLELIIMEDEKNKKIEKKNNLQFWFNIIFGIGTLAGLVVSIVGLVLDNFC